MDWVNIAFISFPLSLLQRLVSSCVRHPVYAVLCLILTFFSMACIWLLVGAEFLGVTLVLVYVGAVMVLFLFVVMMLDIDTSRLREGWVRYFARWSIGGWGDAGADGGVDRREDAHGDAVPCG